MRIRAREPGDRERVRSFLTERGAVPVARLGELIDPLQHPALIAERDDRVVGVLTYVPGERCEVLTLHADPRGEGIGTALIERLDDEPACEGCATAFVITTNDNLDALRFYQRRGFRLVALHPGAVEESRARLKPEIAPIGEHGIPIRDELELERRC